MSADQTTKPARIESGELHEPLRIVVTGGSVSLFVTPARPRRSDGTYGELLPRLLAKHGVAADVRHTGQWFDLISDLRSRYEPAVRNHFPDVLIFNYGMAECQPNVIPTWLSRHFQSWDRNTSAPAQGYRNRIAGPTWRQLRKVQQAGARLSTDHSFRLPPQRFIAELEHVIAMVRDEVRPLVLVLDLDPPGPRFEHWVPGMIERHALYQKLLAESIARLRERHDGEVRLVRASETVYEHGFDAVLPDSIHRNEFGHRLSADLLMAEILDWLRAPAP